jgi:hypothetical protein
MDFNFLTSSRVHVVRSSVCVLSLVFFSSSVKVLKYRSCCTHSSLLPVGLSTVQSSLLAIRTTPESATAEQGHHYTVGPVLCIPRPQSLLLYTSINGYSEACLGFFKFRIQITTSVRSSSSNKVQLLIPASSSADLS